MNEKKMKKKRTLTYSTKKMIFTYSMFRAFQTCRMKFNYRYSRELVPIEEPAVLVFGSAVHRGLEAWLKGGDKAQVLSVVASYEGLPVDDRCKAVELVNAYMDHWGQEAFEIVDVEHSFIQPLINPKTEYPSTSWQLSGRVDGLVRLDGELYILEHKTTSSINDEFVERIFIDAQIAIYAIAIGRELGERVVGAIYNMIEKPGIRMRMGESEEEFAARRAALIAKSKTGTSTAKRQIAETEEEFCARLREAITAQNFRREVVRFDDTVLNDQRREIWDAAADMRNPRIYKNTGSCTKYGRPCEYLSLCRCGGNVDACPGIYRSKKRHVELDDTAHNPLAVFGDGDDVQMQDTDF